MSKTPFTHEERIRMMEDCVAAELAKPKWYTRPEWSEYFRFVVPTYIENWPAELCRMSVAQVDIPLTLSEAHALGSNIVELGEGFWPCPLDISELIGRLESAVLKFPKGAFVRLGSRSPKDAYYADVSVPCRDGATAVQWLTGGSERMADDLHLAIENKYAPHVFVRQWMMLEPWQEFRCFMRARKLVGISQYFYREGPFAQTKRFEDSIKWAIEERFFPEFRAAAHLDDLVFDVFVKVHEHGPERQTEIKLLEINPYFEMTDPCLFDWRDPSMFDGRMIISDKGSK